MLFFHEALLFQYQQRSPLLKNKNNNKDNLKKNQINHYTSKEKPLNIESIINNYLILKLKHKISKIYI